MNQHPRSIVSEGITSALRIIAGATSGKEELVFSEWSRHAISYAITEGMDKVPVIDRLHQAGIAIGLDDTYIQVCLSGAVELAERGETGSHEEPLSGRSTAQPGTERSLIVRRASDIEPEAIEWIWRNRIALSKLWLIAGEPGLGKSQLASMIAATITTGGDWPCGEGQAKPGSVIMLCAEDGAADTIIPRLMAAGADLSRIHIVSAVTGGDRQGNRSFNLQADVDLLESCVARIKDVQLIVIDPISSYMGKVDSHKNTDVRGVLEVVAEMAGRHRVAVLGITHFSKGGGQKAINQFIGSIAFIAAARTAYAVMSDPDDETRRLFMPVKNNLAPLGRGLAFRMEQRLLVGDILASSVAFDNEPVDGTADAMLVANAGGNGEDRSAMSEASGFLEEMLAQGPQPVTKIKAEAEQAGISWATMKRAKKRMKVAADRVGGLGSNGRWDWFPPGTDPKALKNN